MIALLLGKAYLIKFHYPMLVQSIIQLITIAMAIGIIVLGVYLLLLIVKFLKLGIKYYKLKIDELEKDNGNIS